MKPLDSNQQELDSLVELVYHELRTLAARALGRERKGHTMQATALVHETYLALARLGPGEWLGPDHFRSVAALTIRRILVDHARRRGAEKRGGGVETRSLSGDVQTPLEEPPLFAIDEALDHLRALNARQARVVELRWFAGLSIDETAEELGVSSRTVDGDWRMARAWLRRRLEQEGQR